MPRGILVRLSDESGIALVMALGIMMVLMIMLATTIYFASATARDANRINGGQKAYALAEAGVNNAIAQIAPHYPNTTIAGDSSWVGIGAPKSYDTGTAYWSGSFDSGASIWTLTGTGTAKNPTGGSDIVRVVTTKVPVGVAPPPFTKYGLFVNTNTGPTCTDLGGDLAIKVPVYSAGCLAFGGNAALIEPAASGPATVSANIGGLLTVTGSAKVGTATRRINWLAAGGGCNTAGGACPGGNTQINAQTYGTFVPVSLPPVSAAAVYAKANWSSTGANPVNCPSSSNPFDNNNARNNSRGTVNLMGTSYDCTARDASSGATVGRLKWDNSTKTLLVSGTVFVDGNFNIGSSEGMQYAGDGTIYFNGTVRIQGIVCGPGSTWNGTTCGQTWDPLNGLGAVMIVAANANGTPPVSNPAVDLGAGAVVEAGLWSIGNVDSTGHPYLGGSIFVDKGTADINGSGGLQAFINLPSGAPPASPEYNLGSARDFTGG